MKPANAMSTDEKILELTDIIIDQKCKLDLAEMVRESMYHEIDGYKQQVTELHSELSKLKTENIDLAMQVANIKKAVSAND